MAVEVGGQRIGGAGLVRVQAAIGRSIAASVLPRMRNLGQIRSEQTLKPEYSLAVFQEIRRLIYSLMLISGWMEGWCSPTYQIARIWIHLHEEFYTA